MSSLLRAEDLNDFIQPSVACIKPIEVDTNHLQLEFEENGELEVDANGDVKKGNRKLEKAKISLNDCLACSGCITSSEEILIQQHSYKEFVNYYKEHRTDDYIMNLSLQARSSLAVYFGENIRIIDLVLIRLFRDILGFKYIVSVGNARGYIHQELYQEVQQRGKVLTSVCPGWVLYIEKTHKELVGKLSQLRSPQYITSKLAKDIVGGKSYNLSLMPCFDKKLEASRDNDVVNCVITPKEFINMIEEGELCDVDIIAMIDEVKKDYESSSLVYEECIKSATPDGWDSYNLYGWNNVGGSESGGYAWGYLKHCDTVEYSNTETEYRVVTGRNEDVYELQLLNKKNGEVLKRAGVVNGFKNIQNMVRKISNAKAKDSSTVKKTRLLSRRRAAVSNGATPTVEVDLGNCDVVEVMACPSGCINGGGQLPNTLPLVRDVYNTIPKPLDTNGSQYHVNAEIMTQPQFSTDSSESSSLDNTAVFASW